MADFSPIRNCGVITKLALKHLSDHYMLCPENCITPKYGKCLQVPRRLSIVTGDLHFQPTVTHRPR